METRAKNMTKREYRIFKRMRRCWQLYLLLLLPAVYLFIFHYVPMYGATLAFKEYNPVGGIMGSPWVGLEYFERFVTSPSFFSVVKNTLLLSVYTLVFSMPFPILLALSLNECRSKFARKTVQMVTYAPYFISTVIMVALLMQWSSVNGGLFNNIIGLFGFEPVNLFSDAKYSRSTYVISNIWQFTGFNSIIYLAALAGVDMGLYEAAKVDGATKLQKIGYIDLPSLLPTIVILLILNVGQIMNVGFEKVYLMQNDLNVQVSEIIATYTYKIGLLELNFSYSTAVGLFNSIINFILLITVNTIARRMGDTSLW